VADDLALARHEPASVRPSADWLDRRRVLVERADALGAPLLLAAEAGGMASDGMAARLERLARGTAPDDAPAAIASPPGCGPLAALVETRLRRLEEAALAARRPDEIPHEMA
jgi:hypothetical protein